MRYKAQGGTTLELFSYMSDPKIDLTKLKAVRDWSQDLADELEHREDLLPCKARNVHGDDCIRAQAVKYPLAEMKPGKLCKRCQVRWHIRMAAAGIRFVFDAKTERAIEAAPDFS